MTHSHRRWHLRLWIILAPVIVTSFAVALFVRMEAMR